MIHYNELNNKVFIVFNIIKFSLIPQDAGDALLNMIES